MQPTYQDILRMIADQKAQYSGEEVAPSYFNIPGLGQVQDVGEGVINYSDPSKSGFNIMESASNGGYNPYLGKASNPAGGVDQYSYEQKNGIDPVFLAMAGLAGGLGAGFASGAFGGASGAGGAAEAAGGLGGGAFDLGGIAGGVEGAGGATGLGSTFGLGNAALPSTLSSEFIPSAGSASSNGGLSSLKDVGSALLKHPDLLATAGGLVNKLVGGGSSSDSGNGGGALAGMSGGWNPQQQQTANDYFSKSSARQVNPYDGNLSRAPIEGGEHQWFKPMAEGGHVEGDMSGGQDDVVPIMGAHGEYMLDADTVSALGDGSTDAGIRKLDQFRKALREHKRSAPSHSIPPRALSITDYMRGK